MFFGGGAIGQKRAALVTLVGSTDSSSSSVANAHTFTSQGLGAADGTSLVVVLAHVWSNGTQPTITSISIDGTNGTLHQTHLSTNSLTADVSVGLASRATSNTTGTIVVTCNNGSTGARITIYRITRLVSATINQSGNAANSFAISRPKRSAVIFGGATISPNDTSVPTITAGLTQNANGFLSAIHLYKWANSHASNQAASASVTYTMTNNAGAVFGSVVGGVWQ